MDFIIISVIICALIVFIFLTKRRTFSASNLLLSCFYLLILGIFLNFYAEFERISWLYVVTSLISYGTGYLMGAIVYLFVSSLFEKLRRRTVLYSLIPFSTYLLFVNIPFAFSNPIKGYAFDYLRYIELYGDVIYLIELLFFFIFIFKAFKKYKQYGQHLSSYYSSTDENDIYWVKQMLGGVFIFIIIDFIITIYLILSNNESFPEVYVTVISGAFITFYITYHGLFQSEIFIPKYLINNHDNQTVKTDSNSNISNFSVSETDKLEKKLNELLDEKKLFLNDSLKLSDLAEEIGISEKKLSAFFNQKMEITYYQFINKYRLIEFKALIQDPNNRKYALMTIANQSGFKSKTSFYNYFKSQTGMTPAQYYKLIYDSQD